MPNRHARQLRKTMTDAERRLWSAIRSRRLEGYKFRRQHPFGPFILDFACIAQCLVIEVDGGQHADSQSDRHRTAWLQSQGWRVMRFWNNEVLGNIDGVVDRVLTVLKDPHPPTPDGAGPSLSR